MKGFYVHLIWFETPAESSNCLKTKNKNLTTASIFSRLLHPSLFINRRMVGPSQSNLEKIETPTNYNFPQSVPFSLSGFVVLHKLIERSLALDLESSKELIQKKKHLSGFRIWEVNCFPSVKLLMIASNVFHLSWMLTLWRKRVRLYEK